MRNFDVDQLSAATGATRQQIHRLVNLGLITPPKGTAAGARYSPQHISDIAQIKGLLTEGWNATELAELVTRPHHWNRRDEPVVSPDQAAAVPGRAYEASITAALCILCKAAPSACERRIIQVVIKAARGELLKQKDVSAALYRRWRACSPDR